MFERVGKPFLGDTKEIVFCDGGKFAGGSRGLNSDLDARSGGQRPGHFGERGGEITVFEQMRTQIPNGTAGFGKTAARHVASHLKKTARGFWRAAELCFRGIQLDGDGGEFLLERVVKFASDAIALFKDAFAFYLFLDDPCLPAPAAVEH